MLTQSARRTLIIVMYQDNAVGQGNGSAMTDPKDKDRRPLGAGDLEKTYSKRSLVPGFEDGQYELRRAYDRRLASGALDDAPLKRDNRFNVRVSARDLQALQRKAVKEGVPTQSLLASIIHEHVNTHLKDLLPDLQEDDDSGSTAVSSAKRNPHAIKPKPDFPQD